MGKKLLAVLLVGICAMMIYRGQSGGETYTRTSFLLDTIVTVTIYDWDDENTLTEVMEEITRLERLLSNSYAGSDVDNLAQNAGIDWVEISPECEEVLLLAKEIAGLSGGYFDVTTGPLIDLWDVNGEGHYPSEEELETALSLVNLDALLVEDGRAFLTEEGMTVDLGGIAKGYIADKVKDFLLEKGVTSASIDLGRNLLFIGDNEGGNFRLGVQSAMDDRGEIMMILAVTDLTVVTAGISERYFSYEGVDYHHILDPYTGFPGDTGVASVTIVGENSAMADALSTTCLLLGVEDGLSLVESLEGVEALFQCLDGTTAMSQGFSGFVEE